VISLLVRLLFCEVSRSRRNLRVELFLGVVCPSRECLRQRFSGGLLSKAVIQQGFKSPSDILQNQILGFISVLIGPLSIEQMFLALFQIEIPRVQYGAKVFV
jgi:hypothetical protein